MVRFVLKLLALLLAYPAALTLAVPASAQVGMPGRAVSVCLTRVLPGSTPSAVFASHARFACGAQQISLGRGDFWARSTRLDLRGPRQVRFTSLWQERVTLYARYGDGTILRQTLDGHAVTRHLQLGAVVAIDLPERPAPLVQLLWKVEGAANLRGVVIGASVATAQDSARSNLLMGSLYAAFAGLCTALLIYNLALWGALRHRFQLAYCAMVLALLLYAFSSSGALAWAWPGIANNDRLRFNYLTLGASAAAALAFARTFFEPRVFAGALARLTTGACGAMLATAFAFALFAPWHIRLFDRLYTYAFVALMLVVGPILWRAWSRRSNYLWMFAIAWAAPLAMAAVRVASAFSMLSYRFWVDNSTILSMTVEALLSSLAIAYRMRLLSLERDEARASEIAARLLADTDPLTGLLNRRAFLARAIGREGEQTLLIADLDHFKQVNETIGHDGGDEVLRVLARTLRQSVAADALLARIGGEEFAILAAPDLDLRPEDILARLRAQRMPYDVTVTASIGSCTGPLRSETDWKLLYASADRALFAAKSAGRDRVRAGVLHDRIAA